MCKAVVILIAILAIALPCRGQSVFLDNGSGGYGIIAGGSYSTFSSAYTPNVRAVLIGWSISINGRADIDFGISHLMTGKSSGALPFGYGTSEGGSTDALGMGTEIFIYKRPKVFPIMLSIGANFAVSENIGVEGYPAIVTIRTAREAKTYLVTSIAPFYFDADIGDDRSYNSGFGISGQALMYMRTGDNFALTFGPSFAYTEYVNTISVLFGLLFI